MKFSAWTSWFVNISQTKLFKLLGVHEYTHQMQTYCERRKKLWACTLKDLSTLRFFLLLALTIFLPWSFLPCVSFFIEDCFILWMFLHCTIKAIPLYLGTLRILSLSCRFSFFLSNQVSEFERDDCMLFVFQYRFVFQRWKLAENMLKR